MDLEREILRTRGLGNSTYVLASDGEALVVDPPRDAWHVRQILERRGWRLRTVVETRPTARLPHGGARARGVRACHGTCPRACAFDHQGADEGDEIEVAGIALRARATPGHTPEHLAWEVHDASAGDGRQARCSRGSLLVRSVSRTDLLGADATDDLTARQFASLRALAALPDEVEVPSPTHGSGSFCAAGPMQDAATSTIGTERWSNPLFAISEEVGVPRSARRGLHALPDVLPRDGGTEPGWTAAARRSLWPWRRWIRRPSPRRSPPARRSWTPARVPPSRRTSRAP